MTVLSPNSRASGVASRGPAPPNAKQRELARVVALFDRNDSDCPYHGLIENGQDAFCGFFDRDAKRLGDLCLDRGARQIRADRHAPVEQSLGVETAKQHVCVGDSRLLAAACIANRSWIGACATWSDLKEAAIVDPRDAAATGANRVHVDHRKADRIAGNLPLARDQGHRLLDQADIRRGAAHVEGDQVAVAGAAAEVDRANDARGRAGRQRADRAMAGFARRCKATVRLLDIRFRTKAEGVDTCLELVEIAAHHRTERGIQHRRTGTFVLAKFGQHLMRRADELAWQRLAQPGDNVPFMRRVLVAVHEYDGDRGNVGFPESRDMLVEFRARWRDVVAAHQERALVHLPAQVAGDGRTRLRECGCYSCAAGVAGGFRGYRESPLW